MGLSGQEKKDWEFVSYRAKKQAPFWSKLVKGEVEGLDLSKVDKEILECCLEGKYFRGEGHVSPSDGNNSSKTPMEELWLLYIGTQALTEEEEKRGKKRDKESAVTPIKARRIIGHGVLDDKGQFSGQFSYDRVQYLDKKGHPSGKENIFEPLHFHDDGYLDFPDWLYARDQCRKDLFFLNTMVLGNTKMTRAAHQVVCDLFIQKNFDGVYQRGYTINMVLNAIERQNRVPTKWNSDIKNYEPIPSEIDNSDNYQRLMLLLFSRGFFKSVINRADAIQWMLACPDITMMIMTAASDLAEEFVVEIKKQFFLAKGADPKPLHLLFPEYVLRGVDGTSAEDLIIPARRLDRTYPTLWADSIDSTLSGWHCDIQKFDDVVSNANGRTDITRAKLRNSIDNAINLCDRWGRVDMLGTRYFPDDYYGKRIEKYEEVRDSGEESDAIGMKYFVGAAWYVKPEFQHIANNNLKDLQEHMVVLAFPEHASFKSLRAQLIVNEQEFRCQQLNEPIWGSDEGIRMPLELLTAHQMIQSDARSLKGDMVICGDLAREAKKNSDYSVFAAMKIYKKRDPETFEQTGDIAVVVMEVVYGKWAQPQIAEELAQINKRWMPRAIRIEDTGGLESFKLYAIKAAFEKTGLPPPYINWAPVEQGFDAKRNRIRSLEVLLKSDRLYFAMGPWNNETFSQLSQYTGAKSSRTRKDDIPDALSFISRLLPSSVPKSPIQQQQDLEFAEREFGAKMLAAQHDIVFGRDNIFLQRPEQIERQKPETPISNIKKKYWGR